MSDYAHAEGQCPAGGAAGDVAEGEQPQRLAHEPRDLLQNAARPVPVSRDDGLFHDPDAPPGRQEQHHGVIGHLLDEHVRYVGDDDAGLGGSRDVHHVDTDAADADDDALVQPADDLPVEHDAPGGDDRIGIVGTLGKRFGIGTRNLDQVRNGGKRFQFRPVTFGDIAGPHVRRQLGNHLFLLQPGVLRSQKGRFYMRGRCGTGTMRREL